MPATITSIAHYVPPDIYPNSYFENYLDTTDEWIMTRTGIKERHVLKEGGISDMIVPAAMECIEKGGITPDDIDMIIVSTVTPDYMFPNTASIVQRKLGIKKVWGFDISAACSGFIFSLVTAAKLVESGVAKRILLCGSDKMTSITDYNDRTQAVLFGDAAGVVLIEMSEDPDYGILDHVCYLDGTGEQSLMQRAGGSVNKATIETVKNGDHYLYQDGQTVFKAAVKGMADVSLEIMERNNLKGEDVAYLVPHQANLRIIDATARRMGVSSDKVMINIDKYGNTTSATIPMCISEWLQAGKIKKGDNLILASFGAGYTSGAIYLKWFMNK
jgi:3-oxoacyl-[acyl-carrier-protein] synthase III